MRLLKLAIAAVVLVGLYFAGRSAIGQWNQIDADVQPSLEDIRWSLIGGGAMLYAIGLLPSAALLHRAVWTLGGRPKLSTAVAAQIVGHVGKYVPGKAMVLVLRAGVLSRDGVRPMTSTISVFLETFLMMAVGAVVASVATIGSPVPWWIVITATAGAIAAGVPTFPPVLRRIVTRVAKRDETVDPSAVDWRLFAAGWGWSLLSWLLIGGAFTLIVAAMPSTESISITSLYPIATAAISLALVVGFASLLPGGAGIRELVLTAILSVAIGPAAALLSAIAARITFMAVEAAMAICVWGWLKLPSRIRNGSDSLLDSESKTNVKSPSK